MNIQDILNSSDLNLREEITYNNLVEKINNCELTPGKYYTFLYIPEIDLNNYSAEVNDYDFDYESNEYSDKYVNTNNYYVPSTKCFKLTVQAISKCKIGNIAYPSLYDYAYDTSNPYTLHSLSRNYFLWTDFSKWVIYYDINNDKEKYEWASDKSTGTIYYMKDEFENEAWFDFKNFKIKVLDGISGNKLNYTYRYLFDGYNIVYEYTGEYSSIDISVRHHDFYHTNRKPPFLCLMSLSKENILRWYGDVLPPITMRCFNNIVYPSYTLNNGKKLLLFPTCTFLITYDYALANLPIANNCITSKCQGFNLIDCFGCKNTFAYYVDEDKHIVNFYKQNGVVNPYTNTEIIYTNKDYWNLDKDNYTCDMKEALINGLFWPELYSSSKISYLQFI